MKIIYYRIGSVLRYGLISVLLMAALNLLGNYTLPAYVTLLFAAFVGLFIGSYRIFFNFDFLRSRPFIVRLLAQLSILQVFIMLAVILSRMVLLRTDLSMNDEAIFNVLFTDPYIRVYIKAQIFSAGLLFLIELETLLGQRYLYHYITDRYRKPRLEKRVMLFMDLNDSTTIAEQLGDRAYYHFLNDCYTLLTKPAIRYGARVLKYVGDEVVLSWPLSEGIDNANCLRFYDAYRKMLARNSENFRSKFGIIPSFHAGMHQGEVVAAYLGELKKQLDLSGDLMNTTSRICAQAKKQGEEFLCSRALIDVLPHLDTEMKIYSQVNLKGKTKPMDLVGLDFQTLPIARKGSKNEESGDDND